MKYIISGVIVLSLFAFSNIPGGKPGTPENSSRDTITTKPKGDKNKKELIYDFPEQTTTDTGRASFLKQFNKGRVIYKQTCAKCHNVKKDGKVFYPDFSLPQLMDYEMRFQYPEHQDDLKETRITVEELDWVVIFLRYKKLNLPIDSK